MTRVFAACFVLVSSAAFAQVGPQASITCPAGALRLAPGADVPKATNDAPAGSTFCLGAGVHSLTASIFPKTGNTYVGEFGAILDGSGWSSTSELAGAFVAHDGANVLNVTIRNLTIRMMPNRGIHSWRWSSGWVVENNEIYGDGINRQGVGIVAWSGWRVRRNYVHDSRFAPGGPGGFLGGGMGCATGFYPDVVRDVVFEENHVARVGAHQKCVDASGIIWRGNVIEDADGAAIWNDGVGGGFLAEDNILTDNGIGIHVELSMGGIIRRNTIRRSYSPDAGQAIFVSTSGQFQIYQNTIEDNWRGVLLFVTCASLTQGWPWQPDLRDVDVFDNIIRVGHQTDTIASAFSWTGNCDTTPYLNGTKHLQFRNNAYFAPATGWFWLWSGIKNWSGWQAVGHDKAGTLNSNPIPYTPTGINIMAAA